MLTCTVHICLLYKDTDLYSFMIKYNIIHSVFLIAHIIKIIEAERKIAMELGFEKRWGRDGAWLAWKKEDERVDRDMGQGLQEKKMREK